MHDRNIAAQVKREQGLGCGAWSNLKAAATKLCLLMLVALTAVTADLTIAKTVPALPAWMSFAAGWVSVSTDPVVILPLLAGAFIAARCFREFGFLELITSLLIRSILAVGIATLLKLAIGRARPNQGSMDFLLFHPFAGQDMFASAPSAQATLAGAFGCSLAVVFPKLQVPILAAVMVVCLSRVFVGEHWTSDVIFGCTLGWAIVAVTKALQSLPQRDLAR
ncbi:phosphatase PAP2 family protein [Rhizobium sp. ZK1]|uniref:phosphatase PAP2 family protein n=1 Tax=Rhizobium sp. ZK1 TaxID=3389872 RepID=UPI0039F72749